MTDPANTEDGSALMGSSRLQVGQCSPLQPTAKSLHTTCKRAQPHAPIAPSAGRAVERSGAVREQLLPKLRKAAS